MPALLASMAAALLAAAPAVTAAREHLAQHRLEEMLFDLQGKPLGGADAKEAARLLGQAAEESRQDPLLSLQLAQRALKLSPQEPRALEACARAALSQQQFDLAEPCADRWVKASRRSARARLLRARIAIEEGDWALARKLAPRDGEVPEAERSEAAEVRALSQRELVLREKGLSASRALDRQMMKAIDHARTEQAAPRAAGDRVVLYGTGWCGYCKKARAWLAERHVPFDDKDVEKDPDAAEELARKAAAAGLRPQGVPILDVRGTLISGFNPNAMETALRGVPQLQ